MTEVTITIHTLIRGGCVLLLLAGFFYYARLARKKDPELEAQLIEGEGVDSKTLMRLFGLLLIIFIVAWYTGTLDFHAYYGLSP